MIKPSHLTLSLFSIAVFASACGSDGSSGANSTADKSKATQGSADDAKDDSTKSGEAGHGGEIIELGTTTIGPFTVRASRDKGEIKAGGEAPIDVWLTGSDAKVSAVRFWVGTQSGDESVKAKAEIEIPEEPNHWHTHAEVPTPLPANCKLWVEIESEGKGKQVGSFDLKI